MKSKKKPTNELEILKYSPSKPLVFLFPMMIFKKGIGLSRVNGIIKNCTIHLNSAPKNSSIIEPNSNTFLLI
jgi:hypothetical protein